MRIFRLYATIIADRLIGTVRAYAYRVQLLMLSLTRTRKSASSGAILLLSTAFPPSTWGGVFRPFSFSRLLASSGYFLTVMTQSGHDRNQYGLSPIVEYLDNGVRIIRMPSGWLKVVKRLFPSTDGNLAEAYHNAVFAIRFFRSSAPPGLIIATGPEFDNFTTGRIIAEHFSTDTRLQG